MDQVTKIMQRVSKMEKERLLRILIISGLLMVAFVCIFIYCGLMFFSSLQDFGIGDLLVIFGESHEEFFNIIGENLSLIGEYVEWGMLVSILFSLVFLIIILIKTDFPSFPKRFKETKKY
jgi:hypothetical protein